MIIDLNRPGNEDERLLQLLRSEEIVQESLDVDLPILDDLGLVLFDVVVAHGLGVLIQHRQHDQFVFAFEFLL